MWGYIIDGVIIGIIVIFAIIGIWKGLFDSILSLIGTGLSLLLSVWLAKYVSPWINKIFNLEETLLKTLNDSGSEVSLFDGKITLQNVDVAKFCVWVITIVVLFLLIKLAIFILAKIFESVTKNSVTISGINKVLGMVFGAIKGAIISVALIAVASLLGDVPGIGTTISEKIAETKVTSWAYKYVDELVEKNVTADKIKDMIGKIDFDNESTGNENDTEGQSPENSETVSYRITLPENSIITNEIQLNL